MTDRPDRKQKNLLLNHGISYSTPREHIPLRTRRRCALRPGFLGQPAVTGSPRLDEDEGTFGRKPETAATSAHSGLVVNVPASRRLPDQAMNATTNAFERSRRRRGDGCRTVIA